MGYHTKFTLKIELYENATVLYNLEHDHDNFMKRLRAIATSANIEDSEYVCDMVERALDTYGDSAKWYDHQTDMKLISKWFPQYLFSLHGEGEESGDVWNCYFLNGKMQFAPAEIIFPEFDPKELR